MSAPPRLNLSTNVITTNNISSQDLLMSRPDTVLSRIYSKIFIMCGRMVLTCYSIKILVVKKYGRIYTYSIDKKLVLKVKLLDLSDEKS